jgi:homoserine O-succinyltransferase/O-acetyltransferase
MGNGLKIALLDLYEGVENQGMRCIRDILRQYEADHQTSIVWEEFDVRLKKQLPDDSFDLYISSGGPGSPLDSEGSEWEYAYFHWIQRMIRYNDDPAHLQKKHIFFICHSFQLACRFFKVGHVTKRRSTAFGVFPMHRLHEAADEPVFQGLADPFYAVDSRDYQVIQPNHNRIKAMGGRILCVEKERPHVPLERAIMGIRFNEYMVGTQFHPEADATGMHMYLLQEDKKQTVIQNHGITKWESMIEHLNDPDKIRWTYAHILPNFIHQSAESLMETI